jgi:hypothetical protein
MKKIQLNISKSKKLFTDHPLNSFLLLFTIFACFGYCLRLEAAGIGWHDRQNKPNCIKALERTSDSIIKRSKLIWCRVPSSAPNTLQIICNQQVG